ncbi:DNA primase [Bacillus phage BSTP8]|nr:DNA primase [Bacillus phage BSTP5]QRI44330.1 DNA primase [Bacillus phage BSTP8]QRI44438.1 DNA primase [Bacillus phage BSTP10]QRI44486.1 DNA primase [Bacillus phage BSTP12]
MGSSSKSGTECNYRITMRKIRIVILFFMKENVRK